MHRATALNIPTYQRYRSPNIPTPQIRFIPPKYTSRQIYPTTENSLLRSPCPSPYVHEMIVTCYHLLRSRTHRSGLQFEARTGARHGPPSPLHPLSFTHHSPRSPQPSPTPLTTTPHPPHLDPATTNKPMPRSRTSTRCGQTSKQGGGALSSCLSTGRVPTIFLVSKTPYYLIASH